MRRSNLGWRCRVRAWACGTVAALALGFAPEWVAAAPPPGSLAEVEARYARAAEQPEAALELWFEGVGLYAHPDTRPLAVQILALTTAEFDGDLTWPKRPSAATFASRLADPAFAHVFRSYNRGTSPANGYGVPPGGLALNIEASTAEPLTRGVAGAQGTAEGWIIRLRSSGADLPRTVTLRRNTQTGRWQVSRFSSIYVDVRPPVAGKP